MRWLLCSIQIDLVGLNSTNGRMAARPITATDRRATDTKTFESSRSPPHPRQLPPPHDRTLSHPIGTVLPAARIRRHRRPSGVPRARTQPRRSPWSDQRILHVKPPGSSTWKARPASCPTGAQTDPSVRRPGRFATMFRTPIRGVAPHQPSTRQRPDSH